MGERDAGSSEGPSFVLRRHADASLRAELDGLPDVEDRLSEMWEEARDARPELDVEAADFLAAVGTRLESPVETSLQQLKPDDLLLAVACSAGDRRALEVFEREILPKADASLRKAGATPDEMDEVRQRLRERLFVGGPDRPARIESYGARGSLAAWIRVAAVRTFQNLRRGPKPTSADDDALLGKLAPADDPELAQLKETYRQQFREAFAVAITRLSARERTLLRQHWVDGLVSEQLGRLYDVHRATASRWLVKAQEDLVEATRAALAERLGLDDAGARSVLRIIQSRFDASVHRLLAEDDG